MASRYREARVLVRRLCRLPGEDKADFRRKVRRLREHFERFNSDVGALCQWLMALRRQYGNPHDPASFGTLGDLLLDPRLEGREPDESERDRWRLAIFDDVAGLRSVATLGGQPLPAHLRTAMDKARSHGPQTRPENVAADRLFKHLRDLERAHRLVLLKSAAEWVVGRYQRGMENWVRQREEWERERQEWERAHPALTEQVRQRFTQVFKSLVWDPQKPPGVRSRRPRICPYERLRNNRDDCIWAGQMGHALLCSRYQDFIKRRKARNPKFHPDLFEQDAREYLKRCAAHSNKPKTHVLREMFGREGQFSQQRFSENWQAYLREMGLDEAGLIKDQCLPHCLRIDGMFERSKCTWNPHTELCGQYRRALENPDNGFDERTLELEPLYREWRRDFLAPPRKPCFRYPSSRDLPTPKIFGEGFHQIDWERSILRLRLDDMRPGEWIEFGFVPWPSDYRPSKEEVRDRVTSVHIHFLGTRARAGFRFDAPHAPSRLACTQDEIDELRSRTFPRARQDQQFLEAARKRLVESFRSGPGGPPGDASRELRLLAVDLGETGAATAVYQGTTHESDEKLNILKIDRLYDRCPEPPRAPDTSRPADPQPPLERVDPRGLRKEHVGRHLERMSQQAADIARKRQSDGPATVTIADHDLRGLKRHVAWMIRDWVRLNASQIIQAAERHHCDLIVFESLRGFRPPAYDQVNLEDQRKKRWLAMFAYGRIRRKVAEKAVERGMRVVTVPYFRSSQFCSECSHEQQDKGRWRRNKCAGKFVCECHEGRHSRPCRCDLELDCDHNAARVLARVFWGQITLPSPDAARTGQGAGAGGRRAAPPARRPRP